MPLKHPAALDPYVELFVSTSEVGLLRTTESLPDTALWRILPDTWNGGTVKLENVHSGKCVASAGQALEVNDASFSNTAPSMSAGCLSSFVTGLYAHGDLENFVRCGNWDDATGTFEDMSYFGGMCNWYEKTLTEIASEVTMECPDGQFLHDVTAALPSHSHHFAPQTVSWQCCDVSPPPYVWFDRWHTYELKATLKWDQWLYSCELGNDMTTTTICACSQLLYERADVGSL